MNAKNNNTKKRRVGNLIGAVLFVLGSLAALVFYWLSEELVWLAYPAGVIAISLWVASIYFIISGFFLRSSQTTLDPLFAKRIQEVFGLETLPLTLDDLGSSLGKRLAGGGVKAEDLLAPGETRYRVEFAGGVRYTYCALDALMLPFLVGQRVIIRSECPHCTDPSVVKATDSGFYPSPPGVVLSLGVSREGTGSVQQEACPYINLFPSKGHYQVWAADTKEALVVMLSLSQAFSLLGNLAP